MWACARDMGSPGVTVAAMTSRRSVITEKAGSSRLTRPGGCGSATRAPGASVIMVRAEYSRIVGLLLSGKWYP